MPFARPTLTQLQQQAQQDILGAGIPGISVFLRFGVLSTLTWAQAGLAYLHYGFIDWISRQSVPWTATDEFLAGWSALKGVTRKGSAVAVGSAVFSAPLGAAIPTGTAVARADGTSYTTTGSGTQANGAITVPIAAAAAGVVGNAPVGTALSLQSPIAGVTSAGAAATPLVGGAEVETDDALRGRMLQAYASPSGGGKASDWVQWAEAVPSVTRAWCNPNGAGAGTVVLYVMMDVSEAAAGGFPQGSNGVASSDTRAAAATGDQLLVANAIQPLQPVTALVIIAAPAPSPQPFSITGLGAANTAANQAAITSALADMLLRLGSATGTSIQPSAWEAAIGAIPGIGQFTVAVPSAAIVTTMGQLPVLGAVTFTS